MIIQGADTPTLGYWVGFQRCLEYLAQEAELKGKEQLADTLKQSMTLIEQEAAEEQQQSGGTGW